LIVFVFMVSIWGCEKRNCNNVVCPVGQACNNGQCYCADGYEGTDCNTLAAEKYVAGNRNWFVSESCYGGNNNFASYNAFFQQYSSNPSELEIVNLLGGNCSATAYIRTDQSNQGNIIEIPSQSCNGIQLSGQGTYYASNNNIVFQLTYTFNGASYDCTHTFY
jgi:hypothetical protein